MPPSTVKDNQTNGEQATALCTDAMSDWPVVRCFVRSVLLSLLMRMRKNEDDDDDVWKESDNKARGIPENRRARHDEMSQRATAAAGKGSLDLRCEATAKRSAGPGKSLWLSPPPRICAKASTRPITVKRSSPDLCITAVSTFNYGNIPATTMESAPTSLQGCRMASWHTRGKDKDR